MLHRVGVAAVASAAMLALVSGCGLDMEKNYSKMRSKMVSGEYAEADKYLDSVKESFYSKDNRLLYYMDKGMVLHLGKRYQESNTFLEKAKQTADEMWTESIGANAAAWLTTDNSLPYQGQDFEKVLLHFIAAMNFMELGSYDSARVEARQVTAKLQLFNSKYDEAEAENKGKNTYSDDAFARWLSGKLSETDEGNEAKNDAWIDYKKALEVYEQDYAKRYKTSTPTLLVQDALRCLMALGADFEPELTALKARYPGVQVPSLDETKGLGEVVLLHMSGEAPYKIDRFWTAQAGSDVLRIAYPEFVAKPHQVVGARISVAGQSARTELAQNITAIAIQNLNDQIGRIKAKTIARQVAKYIAAKGIQAGGEKLAKSKNSTAQGVGIAMQIGGFLFGAGSAIAEEADKRSWITLPSTVNVGRVFAPAGDVNLEVEFLAANGAVIDRATLPAKVTPGKPVFVTYRTYQ